MNSEYSNSEPIKLSKSSYTILCHKIIYYIIYHTIPYPAYHTIPYHTIPYHTIPYHTIPYHTIPYHTIPLPHHTLIGQDRDQYHIWSGEVILAEAKPSPNITLPDQINMILGEVLSNKCFIIPAHVVCTRSIARFINSDQEAIYQVACSVPLYAYCVIYFRT